MQQILYTTCDDCGHEDHNRGPCCHCGRKDSAAVHVVTSSNSGILELGNHHNVCLECKDKFYIRITRQTLIDGKNAVDGLGLHGWLGAGRKNVPFITRTGDDQRTGKCHHPRCSMGNALRHAYLEWNDAERVWEIESHFHLCKEHLKDEYHKKTIAHLRDADRNGRPPIYKAPNGKIFTFE